MKTPELKKNMKKMPNAQTPLEIKKRMFILEKFSFKNRIKLTVKIISSDPLFLDWHVLFTTVSFKALSNQE